MGSSPEAFCTQRANRDPVHRRGTLPTGSARRVQRLEDERRWERQRTTGMSVPTPYDTRSDDMARRPTPPRTERDSLGDVPIPADRLWGAQTERSRRNFRIGQRRMPLAIIRAVALVKRAAAVTNHELGLLSAEVADLIGRAADEVVAGQLDEHFPLSVYQTGSGTQTHMNVNEVIANRAIQLAGGALGSKDPVHPNDHVNLGQSSNDVFPTAMHLAVVDALEASLDPALASLLDAFAQKEVAFRSVVKLGRTHLQDATPLTLGQEISGWIAQIEQARRGLGRSLPDLHELALGGTAVGTGLNTHPEFAVRAVAHLAERTGRPFVPAANRFAALAGKEPLVAASAALRTLAVALTKIASDLRLLASGPRSGFGELRLPANEPGSSIMPGKVNPTQCEALLMVCQRVIGNDATVALAGASGVLQLNVAMPVIADALLESIALLADACRSFTDHCVRGLEAVPERIQEHLQRSLMLVTALVPAVGYDAAARAALHAHTHGTTLREAAVGLGIVTPERFDELVRPERMIGPTPSDRA